MVPKVQGHRLTGETPPEIITVNPSCNFLIVYVKLKNQSLNLINRLG